MRERTFCSLLIAVIIFCFCMLPAISIAQIGALETTILEYTPKRESERFPDGCLKVPDDFPERMKKVSMEEIRRKLGLFIRESSC